MKSTHNLQHDERRFVWKVVWGHLKKSNDTPPSIDGIVVDTLPRFAVAHINRSRWSQNQNISLPATRRQRPKERKSSKRKKHKRGKSFARGHRLLVGFWSASSPADWERERERSASLRACVKWRIGSYALAMVDFWWDERAEWVPIARRNVEQLHFCAKTFLQSLFLVKYTESYANVLKENRIFQNRSAKQAYWAQSGATTLCHSLHLAIADTG